MNARSDDQRRLLDLAELDRRLRAADTARRTPPQAARVNELIGERTALSGELARLVGARDDASTEVSRLQKDVDLTRARRDRDQERLQAATSPKDAQALEHEIAALDRRISDLEDQELEVMETLEGAESAVTAQEASLQAVIAEGARLSAEAKAHVAEADRQHTDLSVERKGVVSTIPEELLAVYERLAGRGIVAAGLFTQGTCGGCRVVLSPSDVSRLRQQPEDAVAMCPECGCVLVRTEESGL